MRRAGFTVREKARTTRKPKGAAVGKLVPLLRACTGFWPASRSRGAAGDVFPAIRVALLGVRLVVAVAERLTLPVDLAHPRPRRRMAGPHRHLLGVGVTDDFALVLGRNAVWLLPSDQIHRKLEDLEDSGPVSVPAGTRGNQRAMSSSICRRDCDAHSHSSSKLDRRPQRRGLAPRRTALVRAHRQLPRRVWLPNSTGLRALHS